MGQGCNFLRKKMDFKHLVNTAKNNRICTWYVANVSTLNHQHPYYGLNVFSSLSYMCGVTGSDLCRRRSRRNVSAPTCPGEPAAGRLPLAAADAVSTGEDGDAAEAAGLGDGGPQGAAGAVRVRAAPGPRIQALELTVYAALPAAGGPARALPVPPGWRDGAHTQIEGLAHSHRYTQTAHLFNGSFNPFRTWTLQLCN